MRLTIVNQYYAPDLAPTAQLAASLARRRAAQGDTVTVLASDSRYAAETPKQELPAAPDNLRVVRVAGRRGTANSLAARLRQYASFYLQATWRLWRLPPQDVIISLTTPPYIAWPCVWHKRRHRRTKVVLWNMDCYPDILEATHLIKPGGCTARLLGWLNRCLFRRLDHLVSLDEAMSRRLRRYGAEHLPITVIPNWEPAALFSPLARHEPWSGLQSLGLVDRFMILYLGNAGWGHEFGTVLEAAEELRNEPVSFLFVGGGSKREELEQAARARGLHNMHFHPYVHDPERHSLLAAAHLALITLSDEALGAMSPSKLHAGLAMSVPVLYVGPAGGNVDRAVQDFRCGASLRHGDSAGLATFVRSLLHDRDRLAELRRHARHAFEQAYCDEVTLAAFDKLLAALVPSSSDHDREQRATDARANQHDDEASLLRR